MNKVFKRLLSVMLALVMVIGMIPMSAVDVKADLSTTQIYMDNTYANWNTAYAYFYSNSGGNSGLIQMTKQTTPTTNGFVVNIPSGYSTSSNVIFSENTDWTRQTQNISMNGNNAFRVNAGTGKNLGYTAYTYQERTVYFENTGNWSEVYAYAWNSSADHSSKIKMTTVTLGGKTYYKVVFTKTFANIKFASNANVNGGTVDLKLPDVADGNYIVFDKNGNTYTIDSEGTVVGKQETVVDAVVDQVSGQTMYTVPVTFYDYRTDYEVDGYGIDLSQYQKTSISTYLTAGVDANGLNYALTNWTKDQYWGNAEGDGAFNHYAFDARFNYAISQYAGESENNKLKHMLYFGDFYGMESTENVNRYNLFECFYNRAYPSAADNNTVGYKAYAAAKQGIVDSTLNDNGNVQQNGVELPYFNEDFLSQKPSDFISGYNNANAKTIGEVYENVGFPFRKTTVNGVEYYEFDSAKRSDGYADVYYYNASDNSVTYKNTDVNSQMIWDMKSWASDSSDGTGFFPFNNNSGDNASRKLNYGFGMKMEIPFTMTSTGKIKSTSGNMEDIIFEFTGDDDVWVFIDDQLVLDLGGDHAQTKGTINFASKKATVCYVVSPNTNNYNIWSDSDGNSLTKTTNKEYDFGSIIDFSDPTKTHTLTMFYMERGMIESNLKIRMNFPQTNILNVVNKVDTSDVDDIFIEKLGSSYFDADFSFSVSDITNKLSSNTTYKYYEYANGAEKETEASITPNSSGALEFTLSNGEKVQFNSDSALGNPVPFKTGDTLSLYEVADQGKYNTSYILRDADDYIFTSGTAENINIDEKVYAESSRGGDNKFVFENDDTSKTANSTKITAEYTNKVMVEPVVIEKIVSGKANDDTAYQFEIEFSNVFGKESETITDTFTLKNGESKVYEGVPVGTTYKITEVIPEGETSYTLKSITRTVGDDANVATSKESKTAGADIQSRTATSQMLGDTYQYINSYVTPQEYYAWKGHDQTLPIVSDGTAIGTGGTWADLVADENGIKSVTVEFYDSEGNKLTEVPEGVVVNEYDSGDPTVPPSITYTGSKTGIDEFYITVSVTMNNATNTIYKTEETPITVNVYNVDNDIYVLDYGLAVDLNDNTYGYGFLQNDVLTFEKTSEEGTEEKTDALLKAFSNKTGDEGTFTYPSAETEGTYPLAITTDINKTSQKLSSTTLTYKPTSFMDGTDTLDYAVRIRKTDDTTAMDNDIAAANGVDMKATITTMPASVVYYEDNFNIGSESKDSADKIIYEGEYLAAAEDANMSQSNDQSEQYGHDNEYNGDLKDSGNTSVKMTSTTDEDGKYATKATFTFTGTGFDVVGRTDNASTTISYRVLDKDEKLVTLGLVDTFYANGTLYQIPVIHEEGLDYTKAPFTVELVVGKSNAGSTFYLDGIRIYNPLGAGTTADDAYLDTEEDAAVTKVSDLILGNGIINETGIVDEYGASVTGINVPGAEGAILGYFDGLEALGATKTEDMNAGTSGTSGSSNSLINYLAAGPNNEIYLESDAALGFVVTKNTTEEAVDANRTLQIEAKLANVNSTSADTYENAKCSLRYLAKDGTIKEAAVVSSATAMYYNIPVEDTYKLAEGKYFVVIYGNKTDISLGGQCLAFTNLKENGYDLANPLEDTDVLAKDLIYIAEEEASPFVSFVQNTAGRITRKATIAYALKVADKDAFEDLASKDGNGNPKVVLYANGNEITARAEWNADANAYLIWFNAPSSRGTFALELHYMTTESEVSAEYISAEVTVK